MYMYDLHIFMFFILFYEEINKTNFTQNSHKI